MTNTLKGRFAVVTGAASGIGLATATKLADCGAIVLAADINEAGLRSGFGNRSEVVTMGVDMASAKNVTGMIDRSIEQFGALDILVNNAGVMDLYQGVDKLDLLIWRRMMNINLDAPMHAMRRAVPQMLKQGGGSIINIVSTAAVSGAAAGCAYTASKHALLGLSRNIAWTYADRGIRCNAILPGATKTNIQQSMVGDVDEIARARMTGYQALIPQLLEPEDIANVVAFLASDAAIRINGAEIAADAGWTVA
jgi:NAD(P)-dependent dehydrogenase (short-subunit alcohol dehydrogenase family)